MRREHPLPSRHLDIDLLERLSGDVISRENRESVTLLPDSHGHCLVNVRDLGLFPGARNLDPIVSILQLRQSHLHSVPDVKTPYLIIKPFTEHTLTLALNRQIGRLDIPEPDQHGVFTDQHGNILILQPINQ